MNRAELERNFPGDSQMARRMRFFDWSPTGLGPAESWPHNLKNCVRIILTSRHPMFVWWGDRLVNLYNDGCAAFLCAKHPAALGQSASDVWPEIWDQVGPRVESAMRRDDEGAYDEALPFIVYRKGYPEETYLTFSCSPIPNDDGSFGGILCPVTEETQHIISERQLALLHELAHKTGHAEDPKEACRLAASALAANPHDLPFALIYAIDADSRVASLAGTAGMLPRGNKAAPVRVAPDTPCLWPLDQVSRSRRSTMISDLTSVLDELPTVRGCHPLAQAVVMPLPDSSEGGVADVLVVGLNPLRVFDSAYQRFLDLVAARISFAISKSQTYEALRYSQQILAAELETAHRLQCVATQLMGAKGVEGLYEQILDTAMAIVHSDFASIQIFYPERGANGELRLLGHRGFSAEAAKRWEWVHPTTKTTCGEALRTRQRVAVPDVRKCDFMIGSDDLEGYLSAGIHAVQTTPLVSRSGALLGMVSTHWREPHELTPAELRAIDVLARLAADLIERSRTEEKLRASEARLTETERLTKVGGWDRHIDTGQSYWSEEIRQIFGVPNDAPTGFAPFVTCVHPSDREMILELQRKLHSTIAPVEAEYRIIRPNGDVRFVRSVGQAIRNDRGEPVRLIGATQDVTEQVQSRELLRQSEERLKNAERLANLGHWQWNLKSNQTIWSEECFRIFGRPRDYTPSYEDFLQAVVPEDRELVERGVRKRLAENQGSSIELRIVRPDGEVRTLRSISEVLLDEEGQPAFVFGACQDITGHKQIEEMLRNSEQQLRALAGSLLTAQEDERRRLSQELHDDVTQRLAFLSIELGKLSANVPDSSEDTQARFRALQDQSLQIADEVRRLSHGLHPSFIEDFGLSVALEDFCSEFSEARGIRVSFDGFVEDAQLDRGGATCLYRVAQESLRNSVVHGHATEIHVQLTVHQESIRLNIRDNGTGFSSDDARTKTGLGLISMRERIRLARGNLSIASQPCQGTEITASVPLAGV